MDKLAFALCLGGVVLAVIIAMTGKMLHQNFAMQAHLVFVAFQIAALALGIQSRASKLGKTALITASLLLIGSLTVIA